MVSTLGEGIRGVFFGRGGINLSILGWIYKIKQAREDAVRRHAQAIFLPRRGEAGKMDLFNEPGRCDASGRE